VKLIISIVLLAISFHTFACPNLAGHYNCHDGQELTITQKNIGNNITKYSIADDLSIENYYSDNLIKVIEDTTRQSSCSDTTLKVVARLGLFKATDKYSINNSGDLEIRTRNFLIPRKRTCSRI
jgi:hypothetical protein